MALSYEQGNRQKLCYRAGLESDLVRPPGTSQTLVDGSGYLFLHNLALSIVPVPVSLVCLQLTWQTAYVSRCGEVAGHIRHHGLAFCCVNNQTLEREKIENEIQSECI